MRLPFRAWIAKVILLSAVSVSALAAFRASEESWPPPARLVHEPPPIVLPRSDTALANPAERHTGIHDFLAAAPAWKVTVDPLTGGIDRAFGDGVAVAGFASESAGEVGRAFLLAHRDLFAAGLDLTDRSLPLAQGGAVALPDPDARLVRYQQEIEGIPVLHAGVTLAIRDGRVFFVATSALAPVVTRKSPDLDATQALVALQAYLEGRAPALAPMRAPTLAYLPEVSDALATPILRHRLVWILEVRPPASHPWEGHIAYVDAHDGAVIAFFPEARALGACSADPAQLRGVASGGVRPNRADDPEVRVPMPLLRASVNGSPVTTDLGGHYPFPGGTAVSTLDGEYFRTQCYFCSTPASTSASADGSGLIDFGFGGQSGGEPVAGNGSSTPAERSVYFHLNEVRRLLQKWNNATFPEIDALVNITATCNAFSSGFMLGFYHAGGNCRNTAEIRDVVQHELGHTWDRTDGNGILNGALSEWKGDALALMMGGDPCVGESFFISGGPTSTCSGIREVDEKAAGRTDHAPTPLVCPTCATLTRGSNNCGGGVHCLGQIPGQATWHLLNDLSTGTDYVTGAALPAGNPAMSTEQARWFLERLLIGGGPAMQTWDPTASGVSIYDAVALADDNDGNLANGTPHAAYYNAAFHLHELDESPQVADSAECAPLADPVATAVVDRDPATGLTFVRLTWTPVGGATVFDVYRNTRAGDAFLPIAQNVAAGPIVDAGISVGTTYRYIVAAVRKTGCATVSPGANVLSVSIGVANVFIGGKTFTEVPGGSDGDGRIEPGERVSVQLTLQESGGFSAASDVSATLLAGDPTLAPVVLGGPASVGSISAGGSAAVSAGFQVLVGPSIPCDGKAHYIASITGAEGCWLDAFDIPVSSTADGCALGGGAFVEIVPGSPEVVSGTGDGDAIADNCETTTARYELRNSGTSSSGPVTATVATSHPGVTFVPRPDCAPANLTPGQVVECQFGFSLGGATAAGVPFTVSATSAANAAPSILGFKLPAESNPPVFSTVVFGFDSGVQGWTLQGFTFSFRAFTGARSIHAGSAFTPSLCTRATSPVVLLGAGSSTLTIEVNGEIEPLTDTWYDRANVHIVDVDTGVSTVVIPASGFAYSATANSGDALCRIAGEPGWAGSFPTWNLASFDLTPWQGKRIRIELNYATDEGDDRDGIYIDDLQITNATATASPADAQSNACSVPEVSPPATPVPLSIGKLSGGALRFTWQDLGAAYQYSLYAGGLGVFYDHGAGAVSCQGKGAGMTCNGSACALDPATLPGGNLYFLVTATGFGTEGTAGNATAGTRDPLQSSCAP